MTTEHDPVETTLIQQAAADSLRQLRESGSSGGRFVKSGGDIFYVVVRFDRKNAVLVPHLSRERMSELRDKVHHGYNLLASEAMEVFAHYGEPVEEQRKRCPVCRGDGTNGVRGHDIGFAGVCVICNGTGCEVAKSD